MTQTQNPKRREAAALFENSSFEVVSNFDIRISKLLL